MNEPISTQMQAAKDETCFRRPKNVMRVVFEGLFALAAFYIMATLPPFPVNEAIRNEVASRVKQQDCFDRYQAIKGQINPPLGPYTYTAEILGIDPPAQTDNQPIGEVQMKLRISYERNLPSVGKKPSILSGSDFEILSFRRADFIVNGKDKLACEPR
jgi:hypothetical protein